MDESAVSELITGFVVFTGWAFKNAGAFRMVGRREQRNIRLEGRIIVGVVRVGKQAPRTIGNVCLDTLAQSRADVLEITAACRSGCGAHDVVRVLSAE